MQRTIPIAILAAAVFVAGCGDTKRLETQLTQANTRVAELDSTLAATRDAADRMSDSLGAAISLTAAERDSLAASLEGANARAGRLSSELRTVRAQFTHVRDSLTMANAALEQRIRNWETQMANTEAQIATLQERTGVLVSERDSLHGFVERVQPWYDYYRQEAHRNWLKKVFGAGRGHKPDAPEPTFPPTTTQERLEAKAP